MSRGLELYRILKIGINESQTHEGKFVRDSEKFSTVETIYRVCIDTFVPEEITSYPTLLYKQHYICPKHN